MFPYELFETQKSYARTFLRLFHGGHSLKQNWLESWVNDSGEDIWLCQQKEPCWQHAHNTFYELYQI